LEANVTTCEQCGANAVDERGICGNCGWEADARAFREDEDAQSLGETRAAEVQTSVGPAREQRGTMNARFERTSQRPWRAILHQSLLRHMWCTHRRQRGLLRPVRHAGWPGQR
jgi:predicted amidophosphoribosyltransferase